MSGRVLGDDIDTDQLAPGQYMKGGIEARRPLPRSARPDFAGRVQPGDVIVVAGRNFGMGSSREQAAEALKPSAGLAGVVAVVSRDLLSQRAQSWPAGAGRGRPQRGGRRRCAASLDPVAGELKLTTKNHTVRLEPMPDNLQAR
jgi:3-isopropylmalate/(R)-2-methylmalate dehydratase small subunit